MADLDLIDIDQDEKKITIRNNRELYKAIKSGAILAVLPYEEILASVHTVAECVDPILGWATELLTPLAIYSYHEWTVTHLVTMEASAASITTATASPTINVTTK